MKALFIGGIKSGKSFLAEKHSLKNATSKPYYLATTEFIDPEMHERIKAHKMQRKENFTTIEEPLKLHYVVSQLDALVLVECVSIWINNMLYHEKNFDEMKKEIKDILALDKDIVFVLNDVGSGIIPQNKLARQFVDISGKLSQLLARECDEVFHVIAGIGTKIK
ncbi:MAG: bifunctional adenosylcobinamide kinase/adenosylcobinamide-phosphate guanylyltransferase [Helicobacteraceae bacterium]|nr:bifunctional adenosylcobinamide kinase/adenosylcobinamide-phosphate guanylyltransferase [Candidatus Sulfurimonas ponti]